VVFPSVSIRAEPAVALVDGWADKRGTRAVAEAYLRYLYTPEGQTLAAKHYFRPARPEGVPAADLARFPKIEMFTVDDTFGGWQQAQARFFADGGVFDKIYAPAR
jgi:sulfate transport system substrate-binding protein